MTHKLDVARGRNIVARWHAMAEQRLEYLTELFESGRWRRFHSEAVFLENIREAKVAVETWHNLLKRESSKDSSTIDVAWLDIPGTKPSLVERVREKADVIPLQPQQVPTAAMTRQVADATQEVDTSSGTADVNQPMSERILQLTLSIASIGDRYPLLHNAL